MNKRARERETMSKRDKSSEEERETANERWIQRVMTAMNETTSESKGGGRPHHELER